MDQSKLPLEREAAMALRDNLQDLREDQAYRLVQVRLEDLLSQCQRSLEAEQDPLSVRHLQGQVLAYRKALEMIPGLVKEIDNTEYGGSAHDGSS